MTIHINAINEGMVGKCISIIFNDGRQLPIYKFQSMEEKEKTICIKDCNKNQYVIPKNVFSHVFIPGSSKYFKPEQYWVVQKIRAHDELEKIEAELW